MTSYRGRRAASIENDEIRVTVLCEGGHIAEILHKASGVNPLWTPPWPSIEPSSYNAAAHPEYGSDIEARLLAGIMGHNLCLDLFGAPSPEEAEAGIGVHGEGSVAAYDIQESDGRLTMSACLPLAQIRFARIIELRGASADIEESVESLVSFDRPIGWTQHVTLGPPFLECGVTRFRMPATKSKVFEGEFGAAGYVIPAAEFDWPNAPQPGGGFADLSLFNASPVSSAYTAHLMDPSREDACVTAFHPGLKLKFGYFWKRADFPWLGRWEENCSRKHAPWNGKTIACGVEFGVSPFPETRRQAIDRGELFGAPAYRWLPARGRIEARYSAGFVAHDAAPPK
jgi:hypothetical protein